MVIKFGTKTEKIDDPKGKKDNDGNNKKINTARKTSEKFIPPTPLDQTSENKFVKLLIIFMPLGIELYS